MHISRGTLISFMTFAPLMLYGQPSQTPAAQPAAQSPAGSGAGSASSPTAPPVPPVAPSSVLQPALTLVESTLNSVKLDKWKRGSVRDEAGDNVNAMLNDIKKNVPPLLTDADSAPGALSKSLPLMKHMDALYDVLLRVEEGARVSAPPDQVDQLQDALKKFSSARIELYDALTDRAAGQEKQVVDLQSTVKTQKAALEEHKAAPPPAPVPCTPPKPAVKKKRAAPKATPPANGQPAPAQQQPKPTPQAQPKTQ